MTDKQKKPDLKSDETDAASDLPPGRQSLQSEDRAKRLRIAIRGAGRREEIARRSGIALSTLSSYLGGGEMKLSAAIALAEVCNVSLEWLATGQGPMRSGELPPELKATRAERPVSSNLFGTLDIDRMARALEKALELFAERGHRPSMRRLAQVVLLLYDDFVDPAQQDRRVSGLVFHDEGDRDEPS